MEKVGLSITELEEILKKWIVIFGLEEWKIKLEIKNFKRKDFRQSGDIKIKLKDKEAVLLVTNNPFRDEESTIIHELLHLLFWKYDTFAEKTILKNCKKFEGDHMEYMINLEETVKNFTDIFQKLENKKGE